MAETLCSVGLDVGTTSTQMVVSDLEIENQASGFAVPEMVIRDRKIRYRSPVHFTPLLDGDHMDAQALRKLVEEEYRKAGITRQQVQTGAIIITGETSRKENAREVLEALSQYAGNFVVAAAGPDLESRLAAKGSGAVSWSEKTGRRVLHMDIGGGTSNLALIEGGEILDTACFNVGGRLIIYDENLRIQWISPALKGIFAGKIGDTFEETQASALTEQLVEILEMAAGLRTPDPRLSQFISQGAGALDPKLLGKEIVLSFSGGVADCIQKIVPWREFGDLGPLLGRTIRRSRLCRGEYRLGEQTIRATVIGAGCHAAQLSGSTVYCRNVEFPLKNLPSAVLRSLEPEHIRQQILRSEERPVLMLPPMEGANYETLRKTAEALTESAGDGPLYVSMTEDLAKALGQLLALRLPESTPILCIDRVILGEECYLDVGAPVGSAIPVVVKTLILEKG